MEKSARNLLLLRILEANHSNSFKGKFGTIANKTTEADEDRIGAQD